jgi:hypothetical protein
VEKEGGRREKRLRKRLASNVAQGSSQPANHEKRKLLRATAAAEGRKEKANLGAWKVTAALYEVASLG